MTSSIHTLNSSVKRRRYPRHWYLAVAILRVSGTVEWGPASMRQTSIKLRIQVKSSNRPLH